MLREFTWCVDAGATQETELITNNVKFGDGYEQVSSLGMNNTEMTWQLSRTGRYATIDSIYQFLLSHKGVTPFTLNINNELAKYRTQGSISKNHIGADVWQVSFTVKHVFLP